MNLLLATRFTFLNTGLIYWVLVFVGVIRDINFCLRPYDDSLVNKDNDGIVVTFFLLLDYYIQASKPYTCWEWYLGFSALWTDSSSQVPLFKLYLTTVKHVLSSHQREAQIHAVAA